MQSAASTSSSTAASGLGAAAAAAAAATAGADMDWDSFAASLDAGATLADFFPQFNCRNSNDCDATAAASSSGGSASVGVPEQRASHVSTKKLFHPLVGGAGSRETPMQYNCDDFCDFGIADQLEAVAPKFADREPLFLDHELEELGVSSFNFIDVAQIVKESAETAVAEDPCEEESRDLGVTKLSDHLSKEKSLAAKLQLLLTANDFSLETRSGWLQQQANTFAALSEIEWVTGLGDFIQDFASRSTSSSSSSSSASRDIRNKKSHSALLLLPEALCMIIAGVDPPNVVGNACFGLLPLLTGCFLLGEELIDAEGSTANTTACVGKQGGKSEEEDWMTCCSASVISVFVHSYRTTYEAVMRAAGILRIPPDQFMEQLRLLHHSAKHIPASSSSLLDALVVRSLSYVLRELQAVYLRCRQ